MTTRHTTFDLDLGSEPAVAVCGDWHGNTGAALQTIKHAVRTGADVIVQAGDFGYGWDRGKYVRKVSAEAERLRIPVLFVDGNHENFDRLYELPVREDGLREVAPWVFHIPRGTVWQWGQVVFMGAGGGYSVDKLYRVPGVSWWPQETINGEELARCVSAGKVDVLITHDAGAGWSIPGTHRTVDLFPVEEIERSEKHRARVREIMDAVKPRLALHGHYHTRYELELVSGTVVVGLADDSSVDTPDMHMFRINTDATFDTQFPAKNAA